MNNLTILELICRMMSVYAPPAMTAEFRNRSSHRYDYYDSWRRVLHMADHYLITPALWNKIVSRKWNTLLPETVCCYVNALHTLNLQRNKHLMQQACEVIGSLNAVGIRPLLFKGAVQLFKPLHPDTGCRIMSDLDILIPADRIAGARKAIYSIGYFTKKVAYDSSRLHHGAPLVRYGACGSVELHRQVLHEQAVSVLSAEAVWGAAEKIVADGLEFYVPCPSHDALITILHSQVGHNFHRLCRFDLRQLYDLSAIVARNGGHIDWMMIQRLVNAAGFTNILNANLLAVNRLFGMPLPPTIHPGPCARIHFMACLAVLRWSLAQRLASRLNEFAIDRIHRRYGCRQGFVALIAYRTKYLAHYLGARVKSRSINSNTTF